MTPLHNAATAYFSYSYETAEKARAFYESRSKDIVPYRMNYIGIQEFYEINNKFFKLNRQNNGDTYLNNLRNIIPVDRWHEGKNWTHFCFNFRPAIYHVITWQKLPLIVSLLTAPEGRSWLNRSYHPRPGQLTSEYPIHTAVTMACAYTCRQEYSDQSKQIVHTLLELKANINQVNALGMTPLHVAVKTNNFSVIQLLIERDALVDPNNKKVPLTQKELCVLFTIRNRLIKNIERLLSNSTPLPAVLTTLAREYLF